MEDHARAIDLIFHKGKIADTYNIGSFNEWKNIDLIKVIIKTVDRLLGNPEGQSELGGEPSLQFEEGIEKTVRWYLDHQDLMDNITSRDYERYYEEMYKNR